MAETKRTSTGTVKWFNARKGFGFIAADDGGEDLFVHQTTIRSDGFRTLAEGQPVEFIVDFTEDGRAKAVEVVPLSRSRHPLSGRGGQGAWRGSHGGRVKGGGGSVGDGGRGVDNYWRGSRGGRFGSGGGGRCYNCGRMGHMARDCYHGGDGDGASGNRTYNGGGGRGAGGSMRHDSGGRGYSGGSGSGRGGCYNCGRMGHMARDCYHGGDGGGTSENRRYNGSGGGGASGSRRYDGSGSRYSGSGGGGRSRRGCYNCGEDGHFARDCPNHERE